MSMRQATIQKRKIELLSNVNKVTKFILPYVVAAMFLVVFLVVTDEHGLGVSTDSVSYIGAAESILVEGKLQIPMTPWDLETPYAPFAYFPPLLPLVLAFFSWLLNIDPISSGRWLNALCLVVIILALLLPMVDSYLKTFVIIAILTGETLLYVHLWVWAEPLFLTLVVISLWTSINIFSRSGNNVKYLIVALGITSGLATLTRYAGIHLLIGSIVLFTLQRTAMSIKIKQIVVYVGTYTTVILPWLVWLSAVNKPARELGFYTMGMQAEITHQLLPTIAHWLMPNWWPLRLKMLLMTTGIVVIVAWFILQYYRKIDPRAQHLFVYTILFVTYLTFILIARLFTEPSFPFDNRILSPALIYVALGLSYVVESLSKARIYVALTFLTLSLIVADNVYAISPFLNHSTSFGIGFSSSKWKDSETITWLQDLPSDVTIFSNGADGICAVLPVTAKYTPTVSELAQLSEFEQRVKQTGPAVIVLFNHMHIDWLLGQEQLAHLEDWEREVFSDSIVLRWGVESPIGE
jgi:4-amino-4-deoxy-L-arabinose transferase-like glycosyltransferase